MRRFVRFFLTGPGAILVVVLFILGVGWIIKRGQDKERAEALKRQVQRELGHVKPSDNVDKATAQKEVILSNNRLETPPAGEQPQQGSPPQVVHTQELTHQPATGFKPSCVLLPGGSADAHAHTGAATSKGCHCLAPTGDLYPLRVSQHG